MDLYLDGNLLQLPKSSIWSSFEEFCRVCSTHLQPQGRAIQIVRMDGSEVDCTTPPSAKAFLAARRVEVTSCILEELIHAVLQQQKEAAHTLIEKVMELSTDCLIELPQEVFNDWRDVLESLKPLVGFIPKFLLVHALANPPPPEISEAHLSKHIQEIKEMVEASRQAMEVQDIVLFSDTLELRIVPWLKEHQNVCQKLMEPISQQKQTQD